MEHLHAIRVKRLIPTDTKGVRVKLASAQFRTKITLPFCYVTDDIVKQAIAYLEEVDMQPVSFADIGNGNYVVLCEEFEPLK
jgi:hypothetical protein